jgi:hypothetical protein
MPLNYKRSGFSAWPWWPIFLSLALHISTRFPETIELIYGQEIYPFLSRSLRYLTGWLPFSLGDVLYMVLIVLLFRWGILMISRRRRWSLRSTISISCWIYVFFQIGWGLNYSRLPAESRLGIDFNPSDTVHLYRLTALLMDRTNDYAHARREHAPVKSFHTLVNAAHQGFETLSGESKHLVPGPVSVKLSLFGVIGNHLGYSGYFNPFTGEAQLNDAVPSVLHPFVIAHEMGHQLGYAREQEANLTGFLAARASADSVLRYSAYLDMFLYANAALYASDSSGARQLLDQLAPEARKDLKSLRAFRLRYRSVIEEFTDWWYDHFLRFNGQEDGTRSYGLVVRALLSMYAREGKI